MRYSGVSIRLSTAIDEPDCSPYPVAYDATEVRGHIHGTQTRCSRPAVNVSSTRPQCTVLLLLLLDRQLWGAPMALWLGRGSETESWIGWRGLEMRAVR